MTCMRFVMDLSFLITTSATMVGTWFYGAPDLFGHLNHPKPWFRADAVGPPRKGHFQIREDAIEDLGDDDIALGPHLEEGKIWFLPQSVVLVGCCRLRDILVLLGTTKSTRKKLVNHHTYTLISRRRRLRHSLASAFRNTRGYLLYFHVKV